MLTGMRSFAKSKWAAALLFVLAVALVFTMGNDPFNGVTGGGFVKAGEHSYGARDANRILENFLKNPGQNGQPAATREQAVAQGIPNQIVGALTQQAAALAYADKAGIRASGRAVSKFIADAPRFKDALGRVNSQELQRFAVENGYRDITEFEAAFRDQLTNEYLVSGVTEAVHVPEILVTPVLSYLGEQRTLALARFTEASLPAPPKPTDAELSAYFNDRKSAFQIPERRRISVLSYSPSDFLDKVELSEADIKKEYERRITEFSEPDTRMVDQFVSTDRNAVQAVVDLVKQGVGLDEAVKRTPNVTLTTLTVQPKDVQNEDLSKVMFAVPKGETVGPLKVEQTFHGLRVKEITPGARAPFEQIAAKIREDMAAKEAQRLFRDSEESFYDMAGGLPLEDMAKEIGAPVIQPAPVDASGQFADGGRMSLLPTDQDAMKVLFTGRAGDVTDVIEGDNTRAIYRLDEIVPTRTPEFSEVRADVERRYVTDKLKEATDRIANEIAAAVRNGKTLEDASKAAKLQVMRPPTPLTRVGSENLDPAIIGPAFEQPEGSVVVAADSSSVPVIISVEKVEAIDPAFAATLRPQVEQQVKSLLTDTALQAFQQSIQKEVKVRQNANAIAKYLDSLKEKAE